MKKLLKTIILLGLIFLLYTYRNPLMRFVMIRLIYHDQLELQENNDYARARNWSYVQHTEQFSPNNKQDILNLFYTALDGGWDEVTFYCEEDYPTCMNDIKEIGENRSTLSNINNFVSTFNTYNRIYLDINSLGRINIRFERLYTEEQQALIEEKVDEIYSQLILENMNTYEKIKVIHNYIIEHTVYDQEAASNYNSENSISLSNTAYGPLILGKAMCGGYTDAMALFLDKIGVPNLKVASQKHIWNLVWIDNEWKHLDLTWDDPVLPNGKNVLSDAYFLISSEELEKQNTGEHNYDKTIYMEAK